MANSYKSNNSNGTLGVVISLISVSVPIVIKLIDKIGDRVPLLTVPELCSKKFPLTIEQATAKLESDGFKTMPSPLMLNEAKVEYRDCFDGQVIDSQPKGKSREKAGSMVIIRYVTQEIIDESQRIFDCSEKRKSELKEQKINKREEQRTKVKRNLDEFGKKIKFKKESIESQEESLDISDTPIDEACDD